MDERLERWTIAPLDALVMEAAKERLDNLTKPRGSLGDFEPLIVKLSGMTGRVIPAVRNPHAVIFAADHGVSSEGVSAYGSQVTEEMVVNMCMGSAVSSVLARNSGVALSVIDVGVLTTVRHPAAGVKKVARGTQNMRTGPAMTKAQAIEAVKIGIQTAEELIATGTDLFLVGEMGISNTTASSALISVLLNQSVEQVVGLGTGINSEQFEQKTSVIREAIVVNHPLQDDVWDVLAKLGGFEIAALAGLMVAAAASRVPVVLDGVITGAAALCADRMKEGVREYLIASHRSPEPAHRLVLDILELRPLLDLNLRLGEASGALFAVSMIQNACRVMEQTATFADARVANPHQTTTLRGTSRPAASDAMASRAPAVSDFTAEERDAVYKAILARRDIRSFLPNPIPNEVLMRILQAAHHGPSVGYMQPWNFIVIRNPNTLRELQKVAEKERIRASENYTELQRDYYLRLKIEGLTQGPVTLCVTNDTHRGGPHVLGRNTIPETDLMSTSCAIENMWLAARAEGIGLGWVSFYEKADVRRILNIPDTVDPVALLTLGYTSYFPEIPLLERVGWRKRLDLNDLVFEDEWNQPLTFLQSEEGQRTQS